MLVALQIVLAILGALLLFLSSQWTFSINKMSKQHQISHSGPTGANYLKGDIAGLLLAGAVMTFLLIFHNKLWFWPVVVLLSCVIINRLASLLVDGYTKQGMIAISVEIIMIAVAYAYYLSS